MNMREAFEKWTIIHLMENNNDQSAFRQDELGRYRDSLLHLAYRAWQAAWKIAQEQQKQKDAKVCKALPHEYDSWIEGKQNCIDAILNQGDE